MMTVSVDEKSFEGSGASKKLAKQACARMALTALFNLSFTPLLIDPESNKATANMDGDQQDGSGDEQLVPGRHFKPVLST